MTALATPPERVYTPISTNSFHSHLTWKQADTIMLLSIWEDDQPWPVRSTRQISDDLWDILRSNVVEEYEYTSGEAYGTLQTLEARGITARFPDGRWFLTSAGRKWAEENL